MSKDKTKSRKSKKAPRFTAKNSDRHELYQLSVQAPEHEVEFITKSYKKCYGHKPLSMREDFCGTALLCSEWVKGNEKRTATGVDICADTLAWGREHNIEPLGEDANRITLIQEDVRRRRLERFDVINALNFSYWVFASRDDLRNYFEAVRDGLNGDGIFVLDCYGGWEAQEPMLEPRKIAAGFTYVWDQDSFDPITHHVVNHIHFEFKDGSKMKKAFTYEWRFWTLKEIQELLIEAGFSDVLVYWDKSDDDNVEKYRPSKTADNQAGWLAYLVAVR